MSGNLNKETDETITLKKLFLEIENAQRNLAYLKETLDKLTEELDKLMKEIKVTDISEDEPENDGEATENDGEAQENDGEAQENYGEATENDGEEETEPAVKTLALYEGYPSKTTELIEDIRSQLNKQTTR